MNLKCCLCTDLRVANPDYLVADAYTIVPMLQSFNVGGQQVAGVVALPVCLPCRIDQIGKASKQGLLAA